MLRTQTGRADLSLRGDQYSSHEEVLRYTSALPTVARLSPTSRPLGSQTLVRTLRMLVWR